jgi:heterodisulfide reductase subunit A
MTSREVLVIGGGIAGMQASLDLADMGIRVHLVEKNPGIGGKMAMLDKTFPTNDCAICIQSPKLVEVGRHPNINVMAYSDLVGFSGRVGDFRAIVRRRPRYVDAKKCTACGACAEKCPTVAPNEFNFGLNNRKAIYKDYPQGIPSVYTIDPTRCRTLLGKKCGVCAKVCQAKAIDYEQRPYDEEVNAAAVIIAVGYELFDASQIPEYGYGRLPNVVSSLEMERLLNASGPTKGHLMRPSVIRAEQRLNVLPKLIEKAERSGSESEADALREEKRRLQTHVERGHGIKRLGFVQCVGSRDFRFHKYCSSFCCMHSIKQAIMAREHDRDTESLIFFMDLRTVGKGFEETKLRGAETWGLKYVRGRVAEIVQDEDLNPVLYYEDTERRRVTSVTVDMAVLAVACCAPKGIVSLAQLLGVELDRDNFIKTHPHRPLDTSVPGIFVCGCAQGPMDIPESVVQAGSAAGRAAEVVLSGAEASAF